MFPVLCCCAERWCCGSLAVWARVLPCELQSRPLETAESEARARVNHECRRLVSPRVRTPADITCWSSGRGAPGDQTLARSGPQGPDGRWRLQKGLGGGAGGPLCAPDTRWDSRWGGTCEQVRWQAFHRPAAAAAAASGTSILAGRENS